MNLTAWTKEFQLAAMCEGWILSDSTGSSEGPLQVQKIDSPEDMKEEIVFKSGLSVEIPELETDNDAWLIVAKGNEEHHKMARELLFIHNPLELARIRQFEKEKSLT